MLTLNLKFELPNQAEEEDAHAGAADQEGEETAGEADSGMPT
jgi:hypothetical protein